MKHPRKKKGNDVTVHLPLEALAIIQALPRVDARIFPYNESSVGTAPARALLTPRFRSPPDERQGAGRR
jgi:hypothetical protein